MGIFDSIKNALGSKEPEKDVTVGPSQLLREAGIDPAGLKFGFGTGSIAVTGEIAAEADRQKILDTLSSIKGISTVEDNMTVATQAEPAVDAPLAEPEPQAPEPVEVASESPATDAEKRTYTVKSGDSLWKISEAMYGEGSKYMKIFEANTDLLENPDRIFPGQKLVIPKLDD
jgi:nucleoid-associated protein YgaU